MAGRTGVKSSSEADIRGAIRAFPSNSNVESKGQVGGAALVIMRDSMSRESFGGD